jgi:SAM-dependent methyltransferase
MSSQFWDERYRADDYAYGREPNEFLREQAARIPRGSVLCLAEGEGRNAVFLAGLGYEVTALDFSVEGLRKTERLARELGVEVTTLFADLAEYHPGAQSFTGIVAIFAHLPPPVRQRVHAWVAGALSPGGVFILEAYRPEQLAFDTGGPRDPSLLMTLASLNQELTGLATVIGREVEREVHEGQFHSGRSATVQLVATRLQLAVHSEVA